MKFAPSSASLNINQGYKIDPNFSPREIPRSIQDSLDFCPWWRSMVIQYYLQCHKDATQRGEIWSMPEAEKDPVVLQMFSFKAYGTCSSREVANAMRWSDSTHHNSPPNARKIRSLVLAGASDDEIARAFATTPITIAAYLAVFFDIRSCLEHRYWMSSFLTPEDGKAVANNGMTMEFIELAAAYRIGRYELDKILLGEIAFLEKDDLESFGQKTVGMVTGQAFVHMLGNTIVHPEGRPAELERFLQICDINSKAKGAGQADTTEGGTDAVSWLMEASERGVFDPGMWNEALGAKPAPPTLDVSRNGDVSLPSIKTGRLLPPIGSNARQRLLKSLIGD